MLQHEVKGISKFFVIFGSWTRKAQEQSIGGQVGRLVSRAHPPRQLSGVNRLWQVRGGRLGSGWNRGREGSHTPHYRLLSLMLPGSN
ncbi:hypothetical protein E2C01_070474 [Portunus trituberculatus]|uniref:Uncharacterized protein n=1 Tax=Portunus trituberculatus TaxID=210409 RepID=A0A5B7I1E6_PORTR|nr:hypothetical protein [Portunus trituberculatus]